MERERKGWKKNRIGILPALLLVLSAAAILLWSVQYPPHMFRIQIQVRQLEHIHLRDIFRELGKGNSGKINAAELHLPDDFTFRPFYAFRIDENPNPAFRPFFHHLGKLYGAQCRRIILRLIFGRRQFPVPCG